MKNKKMIVTIIITVLIIIAVMFTASAVDYNVENQNVLIFQFGEIVSVKEEPGIFFKIPIIQKTKKINTGEQLYDITKSDVITSDKKTLSADCYITWKITDAKKYYQTLSSAQTAKGRINTAVYSAMKNVISSLTQEQVISGKDGTLNQSILNKIKNMQDYGIVIPVIEMKLLDLPADNKEAVFKRMISERAAIAAEFKANGEKESKLIRSQTDANVRKIISDAKVVASKLEAEGEKEYFNILANAYGKSAQRKEFYSFMIGLDTMKKSLANGGTITIDKNSPLYEILNKNK